MFNFDTANQINEMLMIGTILDFVRSILVCLFDGFTSLIVVMYLTEMSCLGSYLSIYIASSISRGYAHFRSLHPSNMS